MGPSTAPLEPFRVVTSPAAWFGRQSAFCGCGIGPRRPTAPWSQRSDSAIPTSTVDEFNVLFAGYAPDPAPWEYGSVGLVASTVSFLRDGDRKIIVDPGFVPSQRAILDPLAELGYEAGDITDVIFSHWHPDHTYNAGLFPNAQAHDVWGVYRNDTWLFRYAEGYQVSPGVTLIQTPGHTDQDITTLAATDQGLDEVGDHPMPHAAARARALGRDATSACGTTRGGTRCLTAIGASTRCASRSSPP
jgi:hypothetical protein